MSKRISRRAVRAVLRGPAHLTEEYASDLVAQMIQVDRNFAKQRTHKCEHGRQTRTPTVKKGTTTRKSGIVVPIRGGRKS
jgi:hypothetical protein